MGGTLIFSHIRRLGPFWGVQNLELGGGVRKNEYFWGYEDFVDILVGSSQNRTGFRGHVCAFLVLFLMSILFFFLGGGVAKFQIFLEYV